MNNQKAIKGAEYIIKQYEKGKPDKVGNTITHNQYLNAKEFIKHNIDTNQ